MSDKAPKPVGAYPHARKEGNLLFLSGVGPRKQNSNEIPGVDLDKDGNVISSFNDQDLSNFKLPELSMGMSNDYLKACEYKTTFLRIGSKIFGSRI